MMGEKVNGIVVDLFRSRRRVYFFYIFVHVGFDDFEEV